MDKGAVGFEAQRLAVHGWHPALPEACAGPLGCGVDVKPTLLALEDRLAAVVREIDLERAVRAKASLGSQSAQVVGNRRRPISGPDGVPRQVLVDDVEDLPFGQMAAGEERLWTYAGAKAWLYACPTGGFSISIGRWWTASAGPPREPVSPELSDQDGRPAGRGCGQRVPGRTDKAVPLFFLRGRFSRPSRSGDQRDWGSATSGHI